MYQRPLGPHDPPWSACFNYTSLEESKTVIQHEQINTGTNIGLTIVTKTLIKNVKLFCEAVGG